MIFPVNSIHANALSEEDGERREDVETTASILT
jgi:hypothetical protein